MSHPTRGPARSVGIGGQAMGAGGRHELLKFSLAGCEAAPMSHPTRGPARSVGIGGQAMGAGGRHEIFCSSRIRSEASS